MRYETRDDQRVSATGTTHKQLKHKQYTISLLSRRTVYLPYMIRCIPFSIIYLLNVSEAVVLDSFCIERYTTTYRTKRERGGTTKKNNNKTLTQYHYLSRRTVYLPYSFHCILVQNHIHQGRIYRKRERKRASKLMIKTTSENSQKSDPKTHRKRGVGNRPFLHFFQRVSPSNAHSPKTVMANAREKHFFLLKI